MTYNTAVLECHMYKYVKNSFLFNIIFTIYYICTRTRSRCPLVIMAREDARGGAGGARAPPKFHLLNRPFKIQVERYMVLQNLPL